MIAANFYIRLTKLDLSTQIWVALSNNRQTYLLFQIYKNNPTLQK
jgi:hypothetical protein